MTPHRIGKVAMVIAAHIRGIISHADAIVHELFPITLTWSAKSHFNFNSVWQLHFIGQNHNTVFDDAFESHDKSPALILRRQD